MRGRRSHEERRMYHQRGPEQSSNLTKYRVCRSCHIHPLQETIFRRRRKRPETKAAYLSRRPTTGIAMLALILNAIYRILLSAAVPGIVREGARR
jgi:hypothetical protein